MPSFSLATTYWPRRKGALLWSQFDRGEVREELQQIAALGIATIRLPLHWEDFQPRPERVSLVALRALEQTLDLAQDAQLMVVPGLLPLAVAGAVHLPSWTTAASYAADLTLATKFGPLLIVRNETRPPLVWERTNHQTEVRDLWNNPAMREAQRKLQAEVVGYFADHPVLYGWELGNGIELARAPSSSDAFAEWLGETVDVAREYGARGPLFYTASLRSLIRREGPRPEAIVAAGCQPVISLVPGEPALRNQPLTAELARFVVTLVGSLCGTAPIIVLGAPAVTQASNTTFADQAYGYTVEQPLLDIDEYARLIETLLRSVVQSGGTGAWLLHTFCYGQPFLPADAHSQRERMMGMFDTTGDELPVAGAVRSFAQSAPNSSSDTHFTLDVEGYWADPASAFQRLWAAWQAPLES